MHARVLRGPHRDGSGRWYWRARIFEHGGERTVLTGWYTRDALLEAVHELIRTGLQPPPPDEGVVETVRDLLEHWVAAQEHRVDTSATWRRNARNSGRRLCRAIGGVYLERVDRAVIERYRDTTLRELASGTVRQDVKMLRAAWRWGRELRLVPNVELPSVRLQLRPAREPYTPPPDDIRRVLEQMDDAWPRLVLVLLFGTGARIGEIAALRWRDIDLEAATLHVRGKTGSRVVPLHRQVLEVLETWGAGEPDAGLFGVSPKYVTAKFGAHHLPRACDAAGVRRFTPKDVRSGAVDALYRPGLDPAAAGAILGHSPVVALQYYRRVTLDDRRATAAKASLGVLEPAGEVLTFPAGTGTDPGTTGR